jgi:hypothetical protein
MNKWGYNSKVGKIQSQSRNLFGNDNRNGVPGIIITDHNNRCEISFSEFAGRELNMLDIGSDRDKRQKIIFFDKQSIDRNLIKSLIPGNIFPIHPGAGKQGNGEDSLTYFLDIESGNISKINYVPDKEYKVSSSEFLLLLNKIQTNKLLFDAPSKFSETMVSNYIFKEIYNSRLNFLKEIFKRLPPRMYEAKIINPTVYSIYSTPRLQIKQVETTKLLEVAFAKYKYNRINIFDSKMSLRVSEKTIDYIAFKNESDRFLELTYEILEYFGEIQTREGDKVNRVAPNAEQHTPSGMDQEMYMGVLMDDGKYAAKVINPYKHNPRKALMDLVPTFSKASDWDRTSAVSILDIPNNTVLYWDKNSKTVKTKFAWSSINVNVAGITIPADVIYKNASKLFYFVKGLVEKKEDPNRRGYR